jgi:LDH2 family malate/lactate/ureidoglycolate dehydrogenase
MGLGLMVTVLSGVLSGAWARVENETGIAKSGTVPSGSFNQPTMGHLFAAMRIDAFQPLEDFGFAMDAMIDALHRAPASNNNERIHYPGEIEFATAAERRARGIPVNNYLFEELRILADEFGLEMPASTLGL